MKIILISVFPPYRGGISTHSSILYQHLIDNNDVEVINYSKQYPSILFPGKDQFDNSKSTNDFPSQMLINTTSMKTWKKAARFIIDYKPELVIFRFWNPFFGISLGYIARYLKKNKFKSPLISICDNIIPHENFIGAKLLTKFYLKNIDGFLVQSETVKDELQSLKSNAKIVKRFHPIYDIYGKKDNKSLAKQNLDINAKNIILFFGIIRDYKGLDVLIEAINILKTKYKEFHLLIVGECYESTNKYSSLIKKYNLSKFITFIEKYVPDQDVSRYFSCSDVVVLPYKTASQSGVLQIAYHFDIPVVTTDVGGLSEYISDGFTGILLEPNNPFKLSEILYENFKTRNFDNFSDNIKEYKKKFSWEYFIDGIHELIKNI